MKGPTERFDPRATREGRQIMSEFDNTPRSNSNALLIALLASVGGLIWSATLSSRLSHQEAALADANQQDVKMAAELRETSARLQVATEELGKSMGLTQKQMDARADDIIARQDANNQRIDAAQKQTAQQVNAVSGEVSHVKSEVGGVKNDVGGVKNDVAKTRSDLSSAISQLQSMRGDMGMQSGLIARNHDELELLKHKGDRNYYEFTLNKGEKKPVGTVTLELRKTDMKKNKLTVNVYSDDKKFEKKDKNTNEPLQFYSGKTPMLYELVVNSINSKNQISGYLATPKNAPVPTGR
jgi:predicted  nucleic acid-binding Zn-ribbon protein